MEKLKDWLKRYIFAEILGIAASICFGFITNLITGNLILVAFVSTWAENTGYYGTIFTRDVLESVKSHKTRNLNYGIRSITKDLRNLFVEFGPAEVLDSFVIRPAIMYLAIRLLGVTTGLFVGSMVANFTFYLPTIIMYEARKKYLK